MRASPPVKHARALAKARQLRGGQALEAMVCVVGARERQLLGMELHRDAPRVRRLIFAVVRK
jgi:hypothetical protein